MNLYLYTLSAKALKRTATRVRIALGSFAGAFLFCILIILPDIPPVLKRWIGPFMLCMAATAFIFKIKQIYEIFRCTGCVIICAFFLGGFLKFLLENFRFFSMMEENLWLILGSGFAAFQIINRWILFIVNKKNKNICEVKLCGAENIIIVNALIDTGNYLREPISKKPVSIVEEELFHKLEGIKIPEKLKMIPYHSVGKNNGMMEGYEIPEMIIDKSGEEIRWQKVIVGISENKISASGKYQMILHPDLIK